MARPAARFSACTMAEFSSTWNNATLAQFNGTGGNPGYDAPIVYTPGDN